MRYRTDATIAFQDRLGSLDYAAAIHVRVKGKAEGVLVASPQAFVYGGAETPPERLQEERRDRKKTTCLQSWEFTEL